MLEISKIDQSDSSRQHDETKSAELFELTSTIGQRTLQEDSVGNMEPSPCSQSKIVKEKEKDQMVNDEVKPSYPSRPRLVFLTLGLMAATLMVALDNYILATAVPRITEEFNSLNSVGWYSSSYFLTQMAFQTTFGHLFTDFPHRVVFAIACIVFEVGSILCAVAQSSTILIIGRSIAGVGGAGLYVGVLATVSYAVPIERRALYLSVVTVMFGVASIAGPLLGGIFTDSETLTWRFCFWINLPIGLMSLCMVVFSFPDKAQPERRAPASLKAKLAKLDLEGVLLLISAFVCLIFALQWAGIDRAWSDNTVWGTLLGFLLLISAFIALQFIKKSRATIPLHIARQRSVAASSSFILFINGNVGKLMYWIPVYFQGVQGLSARESGIRNLAFLVTMLFAPMISGALVNIVGRYVPFMTLGATLSSIGSGLLFTLHRTTPFSYVAGSEFLTGLGLGLCTQLAFTAVQAVLPPEETVLGSSLVSFCNSLGPVLGTNIAQSVFGNVLIRSLDTFGNGFDADAILQGGIRNVHSPAVQEALGHALRAVFIITITASCLAFCCSHAMEWVDVRQKKVQEGCYGRPT